MSELWGAPAGEQMLQQSQDVHQLRGLALAEGQQSLEKGQLAIEQQKRMMQMMQNFDPTKAQGPEGMLYNLADMAYMSGNAKAASDYLNKASEMATRTATSAAATSRAQAQQAHIFGQLLSNVHDEQSWQSANMQYQSIFGRPSPYAGKPYNPDLVSNLRGLAESTKDQALTKAAVARIAVAGTQKKVNQARIKLIEQQTKEAAIRAEHIQKESGVKPKAPRAGDLQAVTDLLVQDYGDPNTQTDPTQAALRRVLARPIAERALELQQDGVDKAQSYRQAYTEAKARGDLAGLTVRQKDLGSAPTAPIPATAGMKLEPNKYYTATTGKYKGKVALWDGTKFVLVGGGK